jgi:dephospho-CoA kinase
VTDRAPEPGPPAARRPLRIGITGPIGCGKSTVARWLSAWGARIVDADALAREVTGPGEPAHDAVLAAFGDAVRAADGTLDRAALASIVFADPAALAALEAIVHPAVRPRILAALAAADDGETEVVVLEAIKLVESGYAPMLDEVWLVTCDPAAQRARLLARGSTPEDADRRIAAQHGLATRLEPAATRVIDTSGSIEATQDRVAGALREALRGFRRES